MNSHFEELIADIEVYLENCKTQPLSKGKILVDKDELMELLAELRERTPDEIQQYQRMLANRDQILSDAQAKADSILAQAQIQTNELVSEHQIMQQAYAQANEVIGIATAQAREILDKATADADDCRTAAIEYTDTLLSNLENIVGTSIDTAKTRYDGLISSLQECYDVVRANRDELSSTGIPGAGDESKPAAPEKKSEEINLI